MSDNASLGLAIAAFVITLSIFVLGLVYFTNVFSVRGLAIDQANVSRVLQDKTEAISRLRRTALRKRNLQDIIDSKGSFKQLVSDYKSYKPNTGSTIDTTYLADVPRVNYEKYARR